MQLQNGSSDNFASAGAAQGPLLVLGTWVELLPGSGAGSEG